MNPFKSSFLRRSLLVELRGGLGNQLFIYSAAKYFEASGDLRLVFDDSGIDHRQSILSFSRDDRRLKSRTFFEKVFKKLYIWLFFRSGVTLNVESQVNFGDLQLRVEQFSRLKGFFQTHAYFNALSVLRQELIREFFKPSLWAQNQVNLVKSKSSVLLHIRAGDYLQNSERFGLLSSKYYGDSLEKLCWNSQTKVFVITDDSSYASGLLEELPLKFTILEGPKDSSVSDSLFLMAHARKLIVANSSYSFWGGLLNREGAEICYPYPWFKGDLFSKSAFPDEWICVASSWRQTPMKAI